MRPLALAVILAAAGFALILIGAAFAAFGPFTSVQDRSQLLTPSQVACLVHGSRARVADPQCGYWPSPVP